MREDMPNINAMGIVMDCCYQPGFISTNVKNSKSADSVNAGESQAEFGKGTKIGSLEDPVPRFKRRRTIRVLARKFEKPFPSDNMHKNKLSQVEIIVNGKLAEMVYGRV
jgi:hypothetical protein